MTSTNLLPCPFCGQRDIPIKNENPGDLSGGYFIECPDCGASTCIRYACGDDPRPLLAATWNRRTPGQCLHQISEPAAQADGPAAPAVDALDATDRECLAIGRAVNRAALELPADGEIRIDIENGAGAVYVLEPKHGDWRYIDSGDVFSAQINAAIDAAIQAAKGDKQK